MHCWVYNTPPSPNCAKRYARCAQAPSQSSLPDTLTTQDDPGCGPIHHICTWRLPERIHFLRCFSIPKEDVVLPCCANYARKFPAPNKKTQINLNSKLHWASGSMQIPNELNWWHSLRHSCRSPWWNRVQPWTTQGDQSYDSSRPSLPSRRGSTKCPCLKLCLLWLNKNKPKNLHIQ